MYNYKFKTMKKVIIFILIFCFCNTKLIYATNEELNKIAGYESEIKRIQETKKKVKKEIDELNKLKNDVKLYIEQLDSALDNLTNELNSTLFSIDEKQKQIEVTTKKLELSKENEEKQYNDMKLRIKFFYENDDATILESIISGNNLADIFSRAEYMQKINDYDRKKLDELVQIKEEIANYEIKLKTEKTELLILKEEENTKKELIENLLAEKSKELDDTNSKINKNASELKKLEADQKRQQARIEAIEREIEARNKKNGVSRTLQGGLTWPCPASDRITSKFGSRQSPRKGASTNHQGIDIGAPTGTTVIAAASGEVVASEYSYSSGNYIMINHGSGVFTIYMHLSKKLVKVGDEVTKRQKIGEVGSTGYSTGPHLHFGVRKNGKYVNPLTYVG